MLTSSVGAASSEYALLRWSPKCSALDYICHASTFVVSALFRLCSVAPLYTFGIASHAVEAVEGRYRYWASYRGAYWAKGILNLFERLEDSRRGSDYFHLSISAGPVRKNIAKRFSSVLLRVWQGN